MQQYDIQEQLALESNKKYTFFQKVRAFSFHIYMCILGPVVYRDKYNQYMSVFSEFVKNKN